jgi:hypothetical protein
LASNLAIETVPFKKKNCGKRVLVEVFSPNFFYQLNSAAAPSSTCNNRRDGMAVDYIPSALVEET